MDHNTIGQKEQLRVGGNNSRVEGQDRGRLGQTMGVGRNWRQKRMYGVDKMDTEENSQEGKLEIWKEEELGWDWGGGVNVGIKYHSFALGTI